MGVYNRFPEKDLFGNGTSWIERMLVCERMGLVELIGLTVVGKDEPFTTRMSKVIALKAREWM